MPTMTKAHTHGKDDPIVGCRFVPQPDGETFKVYWPDGCYSGLAHKVGSAAHARSKATATKRAPVMHTGWSDAAPTWRPSDGRPGFREFKTAFEVNWEIPEDVQRAAATALSLACKELGLGAVTLRWYTSDSVDDLGFAHWSRPDEIWVRRARTYQEVMHTIAHELHHLKDFKRGFKAVGGALRERMEADAATYANTFMRQFWPK